LPEDAIEMQKIAKFGVLKSYMFFLKYSGIQIIDSFSSIWNMFFLGVLQGRPQVKQTIKACSQRSGDAARIQNETCSQGRGLKLGDRGCSSACRTGTGSQVGCQKK